MKYNLIPEGNWDVVKRLVRKEFLDYTCNTRNPTRPSIKITNNLTNYIETLKYNEQIDRYVSDKVSTSTNCQTRPIPERIVNLQNCGRDDLPF